MVRIKTEKYNSYGISHHNRKKKCKTADIDAPFSWTPIIFVKFWQKLKNKLIVQKAIKLKNAIGKKFK